MAMDMVPRHGHGHGHGGPWSVATVKGIYLFDKGLQGVQRARTKIPPAEIVTLDFYGGKGGALILTLVPHYFCALGRISPG